MKSEIFKFDPVIYPFPVLVTRNFDIDELRDEFYVAINQSEVAEASDEFNRTPCSTARTVNVVRKKDNKVFFMVMIFRPKAMTPGIMAHEAVHVCSSMGYWLGFGEPTPNNDEPHAYFTGWVTDCVDSVLRKHPERMTGVLLE